MTVLPSIKWTPSPNFSSRGGARVRLVVAHDCEGGYAGSVAWFAMARSAVSAHLVLAEDGSEATQMVAWGNKAWHACNANPISEGIEAAGYSAKGFEAPEWAALASIVAWRLHVNGIPCQEATAANDWTGFTEHAKLGAWGGGHHDLTEDPNQWAAFVARVHNAYWGDLAEAPARTAAVAPPVSPPGFRPSGTVRCDEPVGSIAWAQARLNALGFARPGLVVDGLEGRATETALGHFQGAYGLFIDGVLTPLTIAALNGEAADSTVVANSQQKLIACGYACGAAGADGDLGPATKAAIDRFRADHGLPAGGHDIAFRTALAAAYAAALRAK